MRKIMDRQKKAGIFDYPGPDITFLYYCHCCFSFRKTAFSALERLAVPGKSLASCTGM